MGVPENIPFLKRKTIEIYFKGMAVSRVGVNSAADLAPQSSLSLSREIGSLSGMTRSPTLRQKNTVQQGSQQEIQRREKRKLIQYFTFMEQLFWSTLSKNMLVTPCNLSMLPQ